MRVGNAGHVYQTEGQDGFYEEGKCKLKSERHVC